MNFLAHFILATRDLLPCEPLPAYVVGTALPDLLPLAAARVHLRPTLVTQCVPENADEASLRDGVLLHLATDTAFHKTEAFERAQAEVSGLLAAASFEGIRVRRFFLAHILAELALDAVLIRADPSIATDFYQAFEAADYRQITHWTESVTGKPLPNLPAVLTRFAQSRYLTHYAENEGVATGLSRLCARARQDTFEHKNYTELVEVVGEAVEVMERQAEDLLAETANAL